MAATKPGNPDRGWNDPPMFLYSSDDGKGQTPSTRKNPLTQRVGVHQSYTSTTPTVAGLNTGLPRTRTPTTLPGHSAPPLQPCATPPTVDRVTSTARSSQVKVEEDTSQELPGDVCDTSVAKLRSVLELCGEKLKACVADDIKRRINVLDAAWRTDKLSKHVQQRMARLSTALSERDYNKAQDVHLSLMVDYVSEVGQWMVGIKRLIMEARSILPHPPTPPPQTSGEEDGKSIISGDDEKTIGIGDGVNRQTSQSVDDLVPRCSSLMMKDGDGKWRPSDKENLKIDGDELAKDDRQKEVSANEEPLEAEDTVSKPISSKMGSKEDGDDVACNEEGPGDQ